MADDANNPSLDILVRTRGDTSGIDVVSKSQDELTGKTKEGGKAQEEAAGQTNKHAEGHRELHKAMHLVMEESPVLGLLLRAALSPTGALILGAVTAFHKLKESIDENVKELDNLGLIASDRIGDMKDALHQAASAIDDLDRQYVNFVKSFDEQHNKITTDLDEQIAKLHAQEDAVKQIAEREKELEKQRIDTAIKNGTMSPEEGAYRIAKLDQRFSGGDASGQKERLGKEFDLIADAMRKVMDSWLAKAAEFDAASSAEKNKDRLTRINFLPGAAKSLDEQAAKYDEAYQAADKKASSQEAAYGRFKKAHAFGVGTDADLEQSKERAEEARAEADRIRKLRDEDKSGAEAYREELRKLTTQQHDAEDAAKRLGEQVQALKGEFESISVRLEAARLNRDQANQIAPRLASDTSQLQLQKLLEQISNTPLGDLYTQAQYLQRGESARTKASKGGTLTDQDKYFLGVDDQMDPAIKQHLMQIAKLSDSHVNSLQQATAVILGFYQSLDGFQQFLKVIADNQKKLVADQAALTLQVQHLGPH